MKQNISLQRLVDDIIDENHIRDMGWEWLTFWAIMGLNAFFFMLAIGIGRYVLTLYYFPHT